MSSASIITKFCGGGARTDGRLLAHKQSQQRTAAMIRGGCWGTMDGQPRQQQNWWRQPGGCYLGKVVAGKAPPSADEVTAAWLARRGAADSTAAAQGRGASGRQWARPSCKLCSIQKAPWGLLRFCGGDHWLIPVSSRSPIGEISLPAGQSRSGWRSRAEHPKIGCF
jgi:hypothetical protein